MSIGLIRGWVQCSPVLLSVLTVDLTLEGRGKLQSVLWKQHPSVGEGLPGRGPWSTSFVELTDALPNWRLSLEVCSAQSSFWGPSPDSFLPPRAKIPALLGWREPLADEELAQCLEHELRKWAWACTGWKVWSWVVVLGASTLGRSCQNHSDKHLGKFKLSPKYLLIWKQSGGRSEGFSSFGSEWQCLVLESLGCVVTGSN